MRKLVTKDVESDGATYVGQNLEMWVDDSGALHVGDGETPGGVAFQAGEGLTEVTVGDFNTTGVATGLFLQADGTGGASFTSAAGGVVPPDSVAVIPLWDGVAGDYAPSVINYEINEDGGISLTLVGEYPEIKASSESFTIENTAQADYVGLYITASATGSGAAVSEIELTANNVRFSGLLFAHKETLPTGSGGLDTGQIWVDLEAGNVLKIK